MKNFTCGVATNAIEGVSSFFSLHMFGVLHTSSSKATNRIARTGTDDLSTIATAKAFAATTESNTDYNENKQLQSTGVGRKQFIALVI